MRDVRRLCVPREDAEDVDRASEVRRDSAGDCGAGRQLVSMSPDPEEVAVGVVGVRGGGAGKDTRLAEGVEGAEREGLNRP